MLPSVTLVHARMTAVMTAVHGRMIALDKKIAHDVKTIAMMTVKMIAHAVKITAMMTDRIALGVIVMMIARTVLAAMMMIGVVRIVSPHRMLIPLARSATFTATQPVTAGGVVVMITVVMIAPCKVTEGTGELTLLLMVLTQIGTMIQGLLITLLAS
jgi:hypothetical protein